MHTTLCKLLINAHTKRKQITMFRVFQSCCQCVIKLLYPRQYKLKHVQIINMADTSQISWAPWQNGSYKTKTADVCPTF